MHPPNTLEHCYWKYRDELYRYTRKSLALQEDVEDILQDTYIRITSAPENPELANPKAYLFTIVANLIRDLLRKRLRQKEDGWIPVEDVGLENPGPNPEQTFLGEQLRADLLTAVEHLKPEHRNIFIMHKFEGLSRAEIAQKLKVNTRTIDRRMVDVVDHFRKRLRDYL